MKVLKVLLSMIIIIGLFLCQAVLLSMFACNKSFTEESITAAIRETNLSDTLVDQALENSSLNSNETAKQVLDSILKTKAGSAFVGQYASSVISALLHGEPIPKLEEKDVSNFMLKGIKEISDKTGFSLTDTQLTLAESYLSASSSHIVSAMNKMIPLPEEIQQGSVSQWKALQNIQFLLSPSMKIGMIIAVLILGLFLIFFLWKSKLGFFWWGMISLICGFIFSLSGSATTFLKQMVQIPSDTADSLILSLLCTMLEESMTFIGIITLLFAAVLFIICFTARYKIRHHYEMR